METILPSEMSLTIMRRYPSNPAVLLLGPRQFGKPAPACKIQLARLRPATMARNPVDLNA